MSKLIDITGERFGRLTVLHRDTSPTQNRSRRRTKWICKCDCGNIRSVDATNLRSGKSTSCGCISREILSKKQRTHGDSETRLYSIWRAMKSRCYNENTEYYNDYGGRGIRVCDEWMNSYESFKEWSILSGYSDDLSIDRINNELGYTPENCRWVNSVAQANNRRSNHKLTYNGETHNVTEWAKILGINPKTIFNRIYTNKSIEEILSA